MIPIEPKQITLIHLAVSQLGLDDDAYRAILWGEYKAESCKDLSYRQAHELIERFKAMGFQLRRKYRTPDRGHWLRRRRGVPLPGNVIELMSFEQARMIEALAGKIAWKYDDGYQRWLRKYHRVDHVRTADKAEMVIESLKKMLSNQAGND